MSRDAKGSVLELSDGQLNARVTIEGRNRVSLALASMLSRDEAIERTEVLAKLARQFRRAGMASSPTVEKLLDMAAASSPAMLPGVLQTASELLIEMGCAERQKRVRYRRPKEFQPIAIEPDLLEAFE